MIKAFDKVNLKNLRSDVDVALKTVAAKYGIQISLKNISFMSERATGKLEFIVLGDNADSNTNPRDVVMQSDFKRYANSFGLTPEKYGTIFKYGHDSYKLVGLKPRAPKMPILATRVTTGQTFKLPESAIAHLQGPEYKKLYGIETPTVAGMCSNDHAYDAKFNPIGKCTRSATTSRKGFGRDARPLPYCNECAALIDESRREAQAEARMS